MRLLYPPREHGDPELARWCETHGTSRGWVPVSSDRVWVISGDELVVDDRHGRRDWGLSPGTRIRLDAIQTTTVAPPDGGPGWWVFDVHEVRQRFMVLTGQMRGTCWEASHATGDVHMSCADPVERLDGRCAGLPRGFR
jgi:hypothetical protein